MGSERTESSNSVQASRAINWSFTIPAFNHAAVANKMKCSSCHHDNSNYALNVTHWDFELDGLVVSANPPGDSGRFGLTRVSWLPGVEQPAVIARNVPEGSPGYEGGLRKLRSDPGRR